MKFYAKIAALTLAIALTFPATATAQIPGAVFSTVCIKESKIVKKFGSKRNYDIWRSLHDRQLNLSPQDKLKIISAGKRMDEVTPYAIHELTRHEARIYNNEENYAKAAELYEWLAASDSATKVEKRTALQYAEKLRGAYKDLLQVHPPVQKINFHFTQSARQKNKSGFCIVSFDVAPSGETKDAQLEYCTSKYFKKSALKTVKSSTFNPSEDSVQEVAAPRSMIKIDFYLMDKCGNLLPH